MLSREDNELLTRVGPGTPMGELMRQYWIPVLQSDDLPEPGGAPLRVKLLCESLVAFRDPDGRVGLLGEYCSHRCASLFFGRNEKGGLRCVYHGWKFDIHGNCIDMPNEPSDSTFKYKIRHPAYPCREVNGIIWTYMGPRTEPPPLPELGWALVPASQRQSLRYLRECNWLQALEGDIDSSHVNYLHRRFNDDTRSVYSENDARYMQYFRSHGAPLLQVVDTDIGVMYGAKRPASTGYDFWRISQFMLPFYTSIPGFTDRGSAKVWVPLDDEHTLVWEPNWSLTGVDLSEEERTGIRRIPKSGFLPNTSDPLKRWRFAANKDNDYLIDREKQRTQNYTGLEESNPLQDGAIQESMGTIVDRSKEHLGTADIMIIRVRRRLLDIVKAYWNEKRIPPGVDEPWLYRRRGVQLVLPQGADWINASESMTRQVGIK